MKAIILMNVDKISLELQDLQISNFEKVRSIGNLLGN